MLIPGTPQGYDCFSICRGRCPHRPKENIHYSPMPNRNAEDSVPYEKTARRD